MDDVPDEFRTKLYERINGISSLFKFNYPLNSSLQYLYPPINQVIIQNIVNALISNQKFYHQTLHLMNKMCLPCPFVPNVFTNTVNLKFMSGGDDTVVPMETSESELESDDDDNDDEANKAKRPPIVDTDLAQPKKLKIKTFPKKLTVESKKEQQQVSVEDVFEKATRVNKVVKTVKLVPETLQFVQTSSEEASGFGKIAPVGKQFEDVLAVEEPETTEAQTTEFISKQELDRNRLSQSQLNELAVFKNYDKGELSQRLYVKNLSKKVDETHLRHIYGRYVNFNNDLEKEVFDIRLMKEGRMKGQAFVTLPSEEVASRALVETNGYMLIDKPMIVQYARSAKPK